MDFGGKVVIITGAGSGIGRAAARKLDASGAQLALCDINSDAVARTLVECLNRCHHTYKLDVTTSHQCQQTVAAVKEDFGNIDFLLNCAGINPTAIALEETTDHYWDQIVDTSLKGTYYMVRACIPYLSSGCAIVNVSSTAGLRATAGHAIYNAAKFGVIGFSKSMALELGPRGIRVNAIAPGSIITPTNNSVVQGEDAVKLVEDTIALRRMGTADEVANVVAFLFDAQSSYVNGSVIEISGGV